MMSRLSIHPHPVIWMIMAVISFSVLPILLKFGLAEISPFLFSGVIHFSCAAGLATGLLLFRNGLPVYRPLIDCARNHPWLLAVGSIAACEFVLLSAGLAFIDVSLAGILFETWPIFMLLVVVIMDRGTKRYNPVSMGIVLLFFQALAAATLVILSHSDSHGFLLHGYAGLVDSRTLAGIALVLTAACFGAAFGACTLRLGTLMSARVITSRHKVSPEVVYAVVMTMMCKIFGGVALCIIGLVLSETLTAHQLFYAVATGVLANSAGAICFRVANLKSGNLGVNALSYATPLFTLAWLWFLSMLDVPHMDYLIIGVMGVVSANLLINAAPATRGGYKVLVGALWAFGTLIYLDGEHRGGAVLSAPIATLVQVLASTLVFVACNFVASAKSGKRRDPWFVFRRLARTGKSNENTATGASAVAGVNTYLLEATPARPGTRRLALASSAVIVIVFAWLFAYA